MTRVALRLDARFSQDGPSQADGPTILVPSEFRIASM